MVWTRVQATQGALTDTGHATNSYLLTVGSPITVGNTIILFAHVLTDNPTPTISGAIDSVGNNYTRVGRVVWNPSTGVTQNLQIFIAPIIAGGGTTPQITVSSNSGGTFNCEQMGMLEYAGLPSGLDVTALGTGVRNSLTIPSGTTLPTAGAGELVLSFFADDGNAAVNLNVSSASPAATRVAALSTNQQAIRTQSWMITEGTTTASATASVIASASGSDSGVGMIAVFGGVPLPAVAMQPTTSMTVGATSAAAVKIETLTDNFNVAGTPDATKWTAGGSPGSVQNVGGQLQLVVNANAGGSGGVYCYSNQYFALAESYVQLQFVGLTDVGKVTMYTTLTLYDPNNHSFGWYFNPSTATATGWNKQAHLPDGSTWPPPASQSAFDPAQPQWFRIREHAGTIYFEYGPDGQVWNSFYSIPDPATATLNIYALQVSLEAWGSTSNPQITVLYDNVNVTGYVPPTVAVVQKGTMVQSGTPPTLSPTLPANITKGNGVICIAQSFSKCNVATITGCGVVWQKAISGIASTNVSGTIDVWYGTNSAGGSPTATVTFGGAAGGGSNNYAVLMEVSPVALEQAVKIENANAALATPPVTPGAVGDLLIGTMSTGSTSPGAQSPWAALNAANDYQAHGYHVATSTAASQQMLVGTGATVIPNSSATVVFKVAPVGVKVYAAQDLGSGIKVVNLPDPVNPQDVATKYYVDHHVVSLYGKQIIWETAYNVVCSNNTYTGGWAALGTGPYTCTITKQYASTGIRVKMGGTFQAQVAGQVNYGMAANGSAILQLFQYYINIVNCHIPLPQVTRTMWPAQFSQINTTGSMTVTFWVNSGATWRTDTNDMCFWTISEVLQ